MLHSPLVRAHYLFVPCLVATVTACDGASSSEGFECHRTDREGTYAVSYVEKAYRDEPMCGPLADTLGAPDDPSAVVPPAWGTCRVESGSWFNDECYREIVYDCVVEQGIDNIGTTLAEVTIQKDAAGNLIEGLLTREGFVGNGLACRSEYDVTARRQRSQ